MVDGPVELVGGRGPQHRRGRATRRRPGVRRRRRGGARRRARRASAPPSPIPSPTAVFGSYDDSPRRATRSRPSATCCTTTSTRRAPARPTTFWTGLGAVRRDAFLAVGGFDEDALPAPVGRGHRPRPPAGRRRRSRSSSTRRSRAPTSRRGRSGRWSGPTSPAAAIPWVALEWRRRRLSSSLNLGWRHRLSAAACVVGSVARGAPLASASRWSRSLAARRAEPLVLRIPAPPPRPACARSPASGSTRCTTSSPSPRCRSGVAAALGAVRDGRVVASTGARADRARRGDARRMTSQRRPYRAGRLRPTRRSSATSLPSRASHGAQLVAVADPDPIRRDRAAGIAAATGATVADVHRCDHVARAGRARRGGAGHAGTDAPRRRERRVDGRGGGARREAARARRRRRGRARGADASAVGRVQPSLRPGRPARARRVTRRGRRRPSPRDRLPTAQLARPFRRRRRARSTSGPTSSTGPAG